MITQSRSLLNVNETLWSSSKLCPLTSDIIINSPALSFFHVPCCVYFTSSQREKQ